MEWFSRLWRDLVDPRNGWSIEPSKPDRLSNPADSGLAGQMAKRGMVGRSRKVIGVAGDAAKTDCHLLPKNTLN